MSFNKNITRCGGIIFNNKMDSVLIVLNKNSYFNGDNKWGFPKGHRNPNEKIINCAQREIKEETGLDITNLEQFRCYSDPGRDPRFHTISTVFTAKSTGTPSAGDDAAEFGLFDRDDLPSPLAFDHAQILREYFSSRV